MTNMEAPVRDRAPAKAGTLRRARKAPATIVPSLCNNVMLRKAARHLGLLFDGVLGASALKSTQCGLLMQIQAMGTPTMKDLARVLVMDLSALGHTLKPLMRDGYVVLQPDPLDRRAKRVQLTPQAEDKLVDVKRLWREAQTRFEMALGPDLALLMRDMMGTIASDEFGDAFRDAKPAPGAVPLAESASCDVGG